MRFPSLGLVFHRGLALGALLFISEHGLHFSPSIEHPDSHLFNSIQFAFLQARSSGLGHCKQESDWYFYHSFQSITS